MSAETPRRAIYVIRREFDISEGDAYNRVLVDRAERRLRALGFFKTVQISTEPGSAPDKVILVVNVEDQSTGSFSVSAGVSTSDGLIAEVALEETNFLGRGQAVRVSVGGSGSSRTYSLSFTDPYFLGTRVAAGFDAYRSEQKADSTRPYSTTATGGGFRLGMPLTDDLTLQLNYKIDNTTISYDTVPVCSLAVASPAGGESICYFPAGDRLTSSAGYALVYLDHRQPHGPEGRRLPQGSAGLRRYRRRCEVCPYDRRRARLQPGSAGQRHHRHVESHRRQHHGPRRPGGDVG